MSVITKRVIPVSANKTPCLGICFSDDEFINNEDNYNYDKLTDSFYINKQFIPVIKDGEFVKENDKIKYTKKTKPFNYQQHYKNDGYFAFLTGSKSNIICIDLDIDIEKGKNGVKVFEELMGKSVDDMIIDKDTMIEKSKHGYHLYYSNIECDFTDNNGKPFCQDLGFLYKGIDIKNHHAYVRCHLSNDSNIELLSDVSPSFLPKVFKTAIINKIEGKNLKVKQFQKKVANNPNCQDIKSIINPLSKYLKNKNSQIIRKSFDVIRNTEMGIQSFTDYMKWRKSIFIIRKLTDNFELAIEFSKMSAKYNSENDVQNVWNDYDEDMAFFTMKSYYYHVGMTFSTNKSDLEKYFDSFCDLKMMDTHLNAYVIEKILSLYIFGDIDGNIIYKYDCISKLWNSCLLNSLISDIKTYTIDFITETFNSIDETKLNKLIGRVYNTKSSGFIDYIQNELLSKYHNDDIDDLLKLPYKINSDGSIIHEIAINSDNQKLVYCYNTNDTRERTRLDYYISKSVLKLKKHKVISKDDIDFVNKFFLEIATNDEITNKENRENDALSYSEFLMDYYGYLLLGYNYNRQIGVALGHGSNGKGFLHNNILKKMTSCGFLPDDKVQLSKNRISSNNVQRCDLYHLRCNAVYFGNEVESTDVDNSNNVSITKINFKALKEYSGGDVQSFRDFQSKKAIEKPFLGNILLSSNKVPDLSNIKTAEQNRLLFIPYNHTFDKNTTLAETRSSDESINKIWNVLANRASNFLKTKKLIPHKNCLEYFTDIFLEGELLFREYLEKYYVKSKISNLTSSEMSKHFKQLNIVDLKYFSELKLFNGEAIVTHIRNNRKNDTQFYYKMGRDHLKKTVLNIKFKTEHDCSDETPDKCVLADSLDDALDNL